MKITLKQICLLILLFPFSVSAQPTPAQDSLLDHMTGKWILKGTIAGTETTHDISSEWVLGHQYIQIKEVSREKDSSGKPVYDAIVFITRDQNSNEYTCLWLDNTGNGGLNGKAIGHAKSNINKIEFIFKGSDNSNFHTTFEYSRDTDTWRWFMDSEDNGKLQSFARLTLKRK
jgi:hypothetical protein